MVYNNINVCIKVKFDAEIKETIFLSYQQKVTTAVMPIMARTNVNIAPDGSPVVLASSPVNDIQTHYDIWYMFYRSTKLAFRAGTVIVHGPGEWAGGNEIMRERNSIREVARRLQASSSSFIAARRWWACYNQYFVYLSAQTYIVPILNHNSNIGI